MRVVQIMTKLIYGLVGAFFVLVGGSVLLFNSGLLPQAARKFILDIAHGDREQLHVIQEWGNAHLLVGVLTFWFIWHYDQSRAFHWALTGYLAVDALIHWFHVAGPPESIVGPIILTVPPILFVTLGLLRWNEHKVASSASGTV